MAHANLSRIPFILKTFEEDILKEWLREQKKIFVTRRYSISEGELITQSTRFIKLLQEACQSTNLQDIDTPAWQNTKQFLEDISVSYVQQGLNSADVAVFIFSLKQPIFTRLEKEQVDDVLQIMQDVWAVTELLDKLGLFTIQVYQKTREIIIKRQQEELLELSTPVVQLWDGILALPMIGTLDSNRTQIIMQSLLQKILETGSAVAIIDITGVPNVDTLVAQHLLKTVTAARLMGTECMISGIRPQIAQTIVHLGVDLGEIVTKASLQDAFKVALHMTGQQLAAPRGT